MLSTLKQALKIGLPVAVVTLVSSAALADAPSYARIRSISYAGTGCPAGSVSEDVALDLTAFTLLFDNYVTEIGPGIPLSASRRNCKVLVNMDFPNGWSYTIIDVDYRGYVALDPGVVATQKSEYYFRGNGSRPVALETNMYGPDSRDYHIADRLGLNATVWSPCGATAPLEINTQVRVFGRNRNARGLATVDSIDGVLRHQYGIQWRRCW